MFRWIFKLENLKAASLVVRQGNIQHWCRKSIRADRRNKEDLSLPTFKLVFHEALTL